MILVFWVFNQIQLNMKKVLLSILMFIVVNTAFSQQTPEELKDKFIAACEAGDKEAMLSLYYPNEKHKEIAEFLVNAYLNPDKYLDFFNQATEFYGLDAYKNNVSIGGFALGLLMFSPCNESVEVALKEVNENEVKVYFSNVEMPSIKGTTRFEKIDGKWWIHQSTEKDYNQVMIFLKAADQTVELGNKLLREEASIERFGTEMEKISQQVEASMKK